MDERRFWAKVSLAPTATGCVLWTAARNTDGYGVFWCPPPVSKARKAHVVAWELEHGPVPPGLLLMHSCDVRHCVNTVHLRVGSSAQNRADMVAKGRLNSEAQRRRLSRGERHDLAARLLRGESPEALAVRFGIHRVNVYQYKRRLKAEPRPKTRDSRWSLGEIELAFREVVKDPKAWAELVRILTYG